eukprot:TRINITY_DN381_c0_g2_i4.p1 TRINITY_DN381_c0_g2~~TRINITY_DN381_c0_g2_i4.p1  ORF type:complete len:782 (-),score=151.34 TRINITY_DN381_c0_g2_i4:1447-3447(-)
MHCDCCDDPEVAVSHCSICSQFLCDFHVADHQKRRQTKDHQLLRVKDLRHSVRIAHRPVKCDKHDKEMEMYCEGCVKPVCTTCALLEHREHTLVAIKEAVVQHKANLKESIVQARLRIGELQEAVKTNTEIERQMHQKAQECRSEVNNVLDQVVALVNQRREQLMESIANIEKEKVGQFKSLRDSLEESVASVDGCCAFAEKVTLEASSQQLLLTKAILTQRLRECIETSLLDSETTKDQQYIGFQADLERVKTVIASIGNVISRVPHIPNTSISGPGIDRVVSGYVTDFVVTVRDRQLQPVQSAGDIVSVTVTYTGSGNKQLSMASPRGDQPPLSPTATPVTTAANVEDQKDGRYLVSYTPTKDGIWVVDVRIKGEPAPKSPFNVTVIAGRDYSRLTTSSRIIAEPGSGIGQLKYPEGIALDTAGNIYVADRNNKRIEVFRKDGSFLRQFTVPAQPRGLALDHRANLLVVCSDNVVRMYNHEGKAIHTFGSKGTAPGQFTHPSGIVIDKNKQIYVADYSNHSVQIFQPDGTFIRQLGMGQATQPNGPIGVAINSLGQVIFSDLYNHCVHIYSSEGTLIRTFGGKGSGVSQFNCPTGVAVDSQDNIIVCDEYNNRIQIFDQTGTFIHTFGTKGSGSSQFDGPRWIFVDSDGILYVTEGLNHRIQVF